MRQLIVVCLSVPVALLLVLRQTPPAQQLNIQARTTHVVTVGKVAETAVPTVQSPQPEPSAVTQTAPVAAPEPAPTPVAQGCDSYRSLFNQYAWDVSTAIRICKAESGGRAGGPPSATCDRGLMQVNCVHADMVDGDLDALYIPATNIAVAYRVYSSQGWNGWTTFKTGAYLRYGE